LQRWLLRFGRSEDEVQLHIHSREREREREREIERDGEVDDDDSLTQKEAVLTEAAIYHLSLRCEPAQEI
jgi:hypothetical protein